MHVVSKYDHILLCKKNDRILDLSYFTFEEFLKKIKKLVELNLKIRKNQDRYIKIQKTLIKITIDSVEEI